MDKANTGNAPAGTLTPVNVEAIRAQERKSGTQ